jgi:hypothetical protein
VYLITSNSPPYADAGPNQQVSAGADCLGNATLNGAGSSDPDGDVLSYSWTGSFGTVSGVSPQVSLPLGVHTVTLSVDDGHGGVETDTVTITVVDTTPPAVTAISPEPDVLWPPNHRLVSVSVSVTATDNCAPSCRIVSVQQRAGQQAGRRNRAGWAVTGALSVTLRAERTGLTVALPIVVECRMRMGTARRRRPL